MPPTAKRAARVLANRSSLACARAANDVRLELRQLVAMLTLVIRDILAYQKLCEETRSDELSRMSAQESIDLAEILLTSEIMALRTSQESERPLSLAVALGLKR